MPRKRSSGLPSRKQILDFIATSDQPAGKREIARAFGLSGQAKIELKALLKDMADEGLIDSAPGRAFHKSGGVPKVTVLRIVDADDSGNVFAVPEQWHADGPPPVDDMAGMPLVDGSWSSSGWPGRPDVIRVLAHGCGSV